MDDSALAPVKDAAVAWPGPPAVVADQRNRLLARRVLAVPAAPGGGGCQPAPVSQFQHVVARFPGGALQGRDKWFWSGPGPATIMASQQHEIGRNKAERRAVDQT